MKRTKLALSALAAITGIGGAFVSNAQTTSRAGTVYDWHTAAGATVLVGTINAASAVCPGATKKCLRGTALNKPAVTVLGTLTL